MATTQTSPEESPRQTVRVVIADDHSTVRKTVRSILEEHPGFEVCGEATDGSSAIVEAERLKPDAVVLNINMPVLNGLEAAREIKQKLPQSAIVILSSHADRAFIEQAKMAGAHAYVVKSNAGESLIKAIRGAIAGGDFVLVK